MALIIIGFVRGMYKKRYANIGIVIVISSVALLRTSKIPRCGSWRTRSLTPKSASLVPPLATPAASNRRRLPQTLPDRVEK